MNQDTMRGQWHQLKGKIKQQWGKLTDDDLKQIEGNSEVAVGRIQERYGRSKDEAKREWDTFISRCDKDCS
jgi:uncharacterized protein YjbJ (UPF0337 family)